MATHILTTTTANKRYIVDNAASQSQEAFYRVMKDEREKLYTAPTIEQRAFISENIDLMSAQAWEYLQAAMLFDKIYEQTGHLAMGVLL